jgi:hypothetical protein
LFQEKCVWASVMPGIRVAPAASTTTAPLAGIMRVPGPLRLTRLMRLPWTSTSPG